MALAQIARDVARIPETAVAETARTFAGRAQRAGGTMRLNGRVVRLTTETRTRKSGTTTTATIAGTPAGAWAIKSNGRRGGYTIRPRRRGRRRGVLRLGPGRFAASVRIRRATRGDDRWGRLVDDTAPVLVDAVSDALRQAVR